MFILISTFSLADANSDAFAQVFKEASSQGSGIIGRIVNALYYGLIIIYRGVSLKISQMFGYIILAFMVINVLKTILQNIDRVDVYGMFKMIIPGFVKNLIVAFILVTPVNYQMRLGVGSSGGTVHGTLLTQFTEYIFTMFYRLGLLFFNDGRFNDLTPGDVADIFFTRPLTLLQETFGFMTFFAIFINIAKIILLLLCLWLCGKIIAVYIANIFTALMLTTFSVFYLIFLTMESTAQIGQKGINIIIVQSVTLFMTVAMMGLSYQVMNLISTGNSVQGIASLTIMLLMLQQTMENIGGMAVSITSGGGLGMSRGDAFMGLGSTFAGMLGGLATWGGAKFDELAAGKEETPKVEDDKKSMLADNLAKARENVGRPLDTGAYGQPRESFGVSYNKDGGIKPGMKNAEESMENLKRTRSTGLGIGSRTGLMASAIFKGMTGDFNDMSFLKELAGEFKRATGIGEDNKNVNPQTGYPYNVISENARLKIEGINLMTTSFDVLMKQLKSEPILDGGMGSMNEGIRVDAYNYENRIESSKQGNDNNKLLDTPVMPQAGINGYMNGNIYANNLENINRNNIDRLSSQYTNNTEEVEKMIRNSIKEYQENN